MDVRAHVAIRIGVALGVAASLAGCTTVSPGTEFYTLNKADYTAVPTPLTSEPAIVVGPVTLPEALDRPQLVTRSGAHRLKVHEFDRWGGGLADEISRAIQEDLVRLLGTERVAAHGSAEFTPDYRVGLDVERFEGIPGGEVVLALRWSVIDAASGNAMVVRRSRIVDSAQGAGMESVVAAQGRALGALSRLIAEDIERLRHLK